MSLCSKCTRLDVVKLFKEGKTSNQYTVDERPLSDVESSASSCQLCSAIWCIITFHQPSLTGVATAHWKCALFLIDFAEVLSQKSGDVIPPTGLARYGANVEGVPRIRIHLEKTNSLGSNREDLFIPHGLQLKAPGSKSPHRANVLRGRAVQPTADFGLVKRWLEVCNAQHDHLIQPEDSTRVRLDFAGVQDRQWTFRLIDVHRKCIQVIESPLEAIYVALSYVWGQAQQLRLLGRNYDDLTREGGLTGQQTQLPRTIADAIEFVRLLGKPYLWVDSLCIVQDDPNDLREQIGRMNAIYQTASLTLVDASGDDANAGLAGSSSDHVRAEPDVNLHVDGLELIISHPPFSTSLNHCKWEQRGWTLQEKYLSKRLLLFSPTQVFFHCGAATWSEDSIWETEDPYIQLSPGMGTLSPHLLGTTLPSPHQPPTEKYAHLVRSYHGRQLSYETDAIRAFTGALLSLRWSEYLFGMPEKVFAGSLLWVSNVHDHTLRRQGAFPSWSWVGWRASSLPMDLVFNVFENRRFESFRSLVRWHTVVDDGSEVSLRPVNSSEEEAITLTRVRLGRLIEDFQPSRLTLPVPEHALCAWVSSVKLYVGRIPRKTASDFSQWNSFSFPIGISPNVDKPDMKNGEPFGGVWLNRQWRADSPDKLEFIGISKIMTASAYTGEKHEMVQAMLVEKKIEGTPWSYTEHLVPDVYERVQICSLPVVWWDFVKPTWQIIALI